MSFELELDKECAIKAELRAGRMNRDMASLCPVRVATRSSSTSRLSGRVRRARRAMKSSLMNWPAMPMAGCAPRQLPSRAVPVAAPRQVKPGRVVFRCCWRCCFFAFVGVSAAIGKLPPMLLGFYVVVSLIAFAAYALDKSAAQDGRWRTPENTLHLRLCLVAGQGRWWRRTVCATNRARCRSWLFSGRRFYSIAWHSGSI